MELNLNWINTAIIVLIGAGALALSLVLLSWFVQFQSVFLQDDAFSQYSILGLLGVVAVLIFGGFYLARAGFEVLKGAVK
ncbi:MAG: hypothetical protein ABH854_05840 [Candidatus Diapherotrites archaeon]|nr:hypothetical protein [Candidatus Micrarchaeota archaeon]MBU1939453.1 hypothetical protein [Candidatus Micrarchaeota archaeon]